MRERAAVTGNVFALLAVLAGACAAPRPGSAPGPPPPATAPGAPAGPAAAPRVDTSLVPLCLRVLADDETVEDELARHPVVGRMAEGMRPQVVWTPAEYAAAAFVAVPAAAAPGAPSSGGGDPRFSWARLRANAPYVRAFVAAVERDPGALLAAAQADATRLLATPPAADPVTLRLVCGGAWDAYVLHYGRPELYFDVGWLADAPVERALPDFQDLLAHELWHRAFHDHQRARWPTDPGDSEDPAAVFLYELLNEGVGHWYSMRRWLAEKADTPEGAERAATSFAQLAREYAPYRDEPDAEARRERLWRSHAGVPFWEKWGAVPGALMIERLVAAHGDAEVRALLDREPYSWALAYTALAEERGWDPLPAELVEDARRLRASVPPATR